MLSCPKCGRELSRAERFCAGCGEASPHLLASSTSRRSRISPKRSATTARCPHCGGAHKGKELICLQCGLEVVPTAACGECGTLRTGDEARFCASCGGSFDKPAMKWENTAPRGISRIGGHPALSVLDSQGDVTRVVKLIDARTVLTDDILGFPERASSPEEGVELSLEGGGVRLEPLHAGHTMFVFIMSPTAVVHGDLLLLGSQVIRYRDLRGEQGTYFGAAASGSVRSQLPGEDVAVLEQLRSDGRVRDCLHLWARRSILMGREHGDWAFPYDSTMSSRHAEVRCDAGGDVTVRDVGSRNGVGMRARGAQVLPLGQQFSLGGQRLRVDLA